MGDSPALIVSNIHKKLTEEHLRKIFQTAVSLPRSIEIVAEDTDWYCARVYFHSIRVVCYRCFKKTYRITNSEV
jgi:hypothetical protein